MKKRYFKWAVCLAIFAMIILYGYSAAIKRAEKKAEDKNVIKIEKVEDFKIEKLSDQKSYLVFKDMGEKVEEIQVSGEVVQKYKIEDDDFKLRLIHQKPSSINNLFIEGIGLDGNWYYTYNIKEKKFSKVPLDEVIQVVNGVAHYGKDTVLNTLILNETTDQSIDDIPIVKDAIYNSTTKKLYESDEYSGWSTILQLGEYFVYIVNGFEKNQYELHYLNTKTGKVGKKPLKDKEYGYFALFSTDEYAYFVSEDGELYTYDKEFNVEKATLYKQYMKEYKGYYYPFVENFKSLALSNNKLLQTFRYGGENENSTYRTIVGILDLSGKPKFTELKKDFMPKEKFYNILYQDQENGLIFILQEDLEDDDSPYSGNILVLDNKTYDLVDKIYMEDAGVVDFVVKL